VSAQTFNENFAWRNGFGGGLAPVGMGCNIFAAQDPASESFAATTRTFQYARALKADGYFGRKTLAQYEKAFGPPSLELQGFDVSVYQNPRKLDFGRMYDDGHRFCGIKLYQGDDIPDRHAHEHARNAISSLLDFLYYLYDTPFTRGVHDAILEAEAALRALDKAPPSTLRLACDAEHKAYHVDKKTKRVMWGHEMHALWKKKPWEYRRRMTDWLLAKLHHLEVRIGYKPMIYSYPDFLIRRLYSEELTDYPLWLSSRRLSKPHTIPGYQRLACQQWTSEGSEQTRLHYDHDLDLNRAPYGLEPMLIP